MSSKSQLGSHDSDAAKKSPPQNRARASLSQDSSRLVSLMEEISVTNSAAAAVLGEPPAANLFRRILETGKSVLSNRATWTAAAGRAKVLSRSFFNPREFSKPVDRTEWLQRVRSNAGHYKLIYSVVFVSALVYTILSSPLLLLGMAATAGAWAYAFVLTSPDTALQVFGFELRRREKLIALVPFSILVVTLTGMINSLIYVLCISSCISLPHASFHEVSELDALDALELQGLAAPDPLSVGKEFEVPS